MKTNILFTILFVATFSFMANANPATDGQAGIVLCQMIP